MTSLIIKPADLLGLKKRTARKTMVSTGPKASLTNLRDLKVVSHLVEESSDPTPSPGQRRMSQPEVLSEIQSRTELFAPNGNPPGEGYRIKFKIQDKLPKVSNLEREIQEVGLLKKKNQATLLKLAKLREGDSSQPARAAKALASASTTSLKVPSVAPQAHFQITASTLREKVMNVSLSKRTIAPEENSSRLTTTNGTPILHETGVGPKTIQLGQVQKFKSRANQKGYSSVKRLAPLSDRGQMSKTDFLNKSVIDLADETFQSTSFGINQADQADQVTGKAPIRWVPPWEQKMSRSTRQLQTTEPSSNLFNKSPGGQDQIKEFGAANDAYQLGAFPGFSSQSALAGKLPNKNRNARKKNNSTCNHWSRPLMVTARPPILNKDSSNSALHRDATAQFSYKQPGEQKIKENRRHKQSEFKMPYARSSFYAGSSQYKGSTTSMFSASPISKLKQSAHGENFVSMLSLPKSEAVDSSDDLLHLTTHQSVSTVSMGQIKQPEQRNFPKKASLLNFMNAMQDNKQRPKYERTEAEKKIRHFQKMYRNHPQDTIQKLCEQLDQENKDRPYKAKAKVAEQAVLETKMDIDEAWALYEKFRKRKNFQIAQVEIRQKREREEKLNKMLQEDEEKREKEKKDYALRLSKRKPAMGSPKKRMSMKKTISKFLLGSDLSEFNNSPEKKMESSRGSAPKIIQIDSSSGSDDSSKANSSPSSSSESDTLSSAQTNKLNRLNQLQRPSSNPPNIQSKAFELASSSEWNLEGFMKKPIIEQKFKKQVSFQVPELDPKKSSFPSNHRHSSAIDLVEQQEPSLNTPPQKRFGTPATQMSRRKLIEIDKMTDDEKLKSLSHLTSDAQDLLLVEIQSKLRELEIKRRMKETELTLEQKQALFREKVQKKEVQDQDFLQSQSFFQRVKNLKMNKVTEKQAVENILKVQEEDRQRKIAINARNLNKQIAKEKQEQKGLTIEVQPMAQKLEILADLKEKLKKQVQFQIEDREKRPPPEPKEPKKNKGLHTKGTLEPEFLRLSMLEPPQAKATPRNSVAVPTQAPPANQSQKRRMTLVNQDVSVKPAEEVFTREALTNPMNKLFKKELKEGPDPQMDNPYLVKRGHQQQRIFDQNTKFVFNKASKQMIEDLAKMKFDYSTDFKMKRILQDQEHQIKLMSSIPMNELTGKLKDLVQKHKAKLSVLMTLDDFKMQMKNDSGSESRMQNKIQVKRAALSSSSSSSSCSSNSEDNLKTIQQPKMRPSRRLSRRARQKFSVLEANRRSHFAEQQVNETESDASENSRASRASKRSKQKRVSAKMVSSHVFLRDSKSRYELQFIGRNETLHKSDEGSASGTMGSRGGAARNVRSRAEDALSVKHLLPSSFGVKQSSERKLESNLKKKELLEISSDYQSVQSSSYQSNKSPPPSQKSFRTSKEASKWDTASKKRAHFSKNHSKMSSRLGISVNDLSQKILSGERQKQQRRDAIIALRKQLEKELEKMDDACDQVKQKLAHESSMLNQFNQALSSQGGDRPSQPKTVQKGENIEPKEILRGLVLQEEILSALKKGPNKLFPDEHFASQVAQTTDNIKRQKQNQKDEAYILYEKECNREPALSLLKVFSLIENGKLYALNFQLDLAHAKAIGQVFANSRCKMFNIRFLQLSNCNLRDEGFSAILGGLITQDSLESITYSGDSFGEKSLTKMRELRESERTSAAKKLLQSVHFISLQVPLTIRARLIQILRLFSSLTKLTLRNIDLSPLSVFMQLELLLVEAQYNGQLNSIDIGYTSLKSRQVVTASDCLKTNMSIANVSLAGNRVNSEVKVVSHIREGKEMVPIYDSDERKVCSNIAYLIGESQNLLHLNISRMNLGPSLKYVKTEGMDRSKSLQAIHFSDNEIESKLSKEFNRLAPAHAPPHLRAYAPTVGLDLPQALFGADKREATGEGMSRIFQNHLHKNIFLEKGSFAQRFLMGDRKKLRERALNMKRQNPGSSPSAGPLLKREQPNVEDENKLFLLNAELTKEVQRDKNVQAEKVFSGTGPTINKDCRIYTRRIGHSELVLNIATDNILNLIKNQETMFNKNAHSFWRRDLRDKDCYICNKSNQVTIFFRRYYVETDFEEVTHEATAKTIRNFYGLNKYRQVNRLDPVMFGSVTDWQPVKMMPALYHGLLLLCKVSDAKAASGFSKIRDAIIEHLTEASRSITVKKSLADSFPGWSLFLYDQMEELHQRQDGQIVNYPYLHQAEMEQKVEQKQAKLEQLLKFYGQKLMLDEESFERQGTQTNLPKYTDDSLSNGDFEWINSVSELEKTEVSDMFTITSYVRPGPHTILVFDPFKDRLYFKHIIVKVKSQDHLTANMQGRISKLKNERLAAAQAEMKIRMQVFNGFKHDTAAILKQAFIKDTNPKHFKPYKFMPDQSLIDKCLCLMLQNFKGVKDAFTILAAYSGRYPNIDEQTFFEFCEDFGLIDEDLTEAGLSKIFADANVEYVEDEDDNNPDDLLNRKEFLEIFTRIAQKKYGDQVVEGLTDIVEEILLPIGNSYQINEFREGYLKHDARLCSVMYKNQNNLRKLYNHYQLKAKNNLRSGNSFSVYSSINMLRKSQIRVDEITDKEISIFFAVSKMTVIDEMAERNKYLNMEFIEFQEFICRIGDFLFNPLGIQIQIMSSSEESSSELTDPMSVQMALRTEATEKYLNRKFYQIYFEDEDIQEQMNMCSIYPLVERLLQQLLKPLQTNVNLLQDEEDAFSDY